MINSKDKPQICKTGQHVLKSEQKYCVIYVSYIYRLMGKGGRKGDWMYTIIKQNEMNGMTMLFIINSHYFSFYTDYTVVINKSSLVLKYIIWFLLLFQNYSRNRVFRKRILEWLQK